MKIVNNVHFETRLNKTQVYIRTMMKDSAKDTVKEATSTQPEQLLTVFLPTDNVTIPTEKVGYLLVTSHLQQFLEDYPPSSDKHAFLPHAVITRQISVQQPQTTYPLHVR